jgi:hypothetical protein
LLIAIREILAPAHPKNLQTIGITTMKMMLFTYAEKIVRNQQMRSLTIKKNLHNHPSIDNDSSGHAYMA